MGTLLDSHVWDDEQAVELSLRPRRMEEFIGQPQLKRNLSIFMRAALERRELLDHVLLFGPPGLGKTTLAHVVANEMGTSVKTTSGPAIEKAKDLATILTNLEEGTILFVDEIHRLPPAVEEILYPAMEDFTIDIVVGKGHSAKAVQLDVPHFTLIGATTRASLLTAPLRTRFGITHRFEFYSDTELATIIHRSAKLLGIEVGPAGAHELSCRSRGTPRIANRLLRRVRDFAQVTGNGVITASAAADALDELGVDELGLESTDRRLLTVMIEKFNGGPVGLATLAATIAEDKGAIEDVYEPYLLQCGLMQRTPRGRIVTPAAYEHLNLSEGES